MNHIIQTHVLVSLHCLWTVFMPIFVWHKGEPAMPITMHGMPYFSKRAPLTKPPHRWHALGILEPYLARQLLVLFLPSSIERALRAEQASNTWQACIRHSLSRPTTDLRACCLASDRAPPSQTPWCSLSPPSCPLAPVRARAPTAADTPS
jgi:hypothetical protein